MLSPVIIWAIFGCFILFTFVPHCLSQSSSSSSSSSRSPLVPPGRGAPCSTASHTSSPTASCNGSSPTTSLPNASSSGLPTATPPDVLLNVPKLSMGRIELNVDSLKADINLHAKVASLVNINAGVAVSIQKVVHLGNLVEIVNRVFQALDLNPLLINTLNNVTSVLDPVVGAVEGLLGSITQGGTVQSFLVDKLGNLVQQVAGPDGSPVSSIVGNYLTNRTDTRAGQTLQSGLVRKTYSYSPLNALVDIVFNAADRWCRRRWLSK